MMGPSGSSRGAEEAGTRLPPPERELANGPVGERFGIYVHCPYCRTKCPYCDFNVAIHREDRITPFVAGLRAELARYAALPWAGRIPAGTLFLGGGTPPSCRPRRSRPS